MWIERAGKHLKNLTEDSLLIVGCKSDQCDTRQVKTEEFLAFASETGCRAIEVSAKNNCNVEEAFSMLTEALIDSLIQESRKREEESITRRYPRRERRSPQTTTIFDQSPSEQDEQQVEFPLQIFSSMGK